MPRVNKPEEHQQKRGEILDAAQRRMYRQGFERMSIQDILDKLGIREGVMSPGQALYEAVAQVVVGQRMRLGENIAQSILLLQPDDSQAQRLDCHLRLA